MRVVSTDRAPAAVGPYSQAVISGGLLFTSGQIPLDPTTGRLVEGGFTAQVERVLESLDALLEAAGSGRSKVVKVLVFLTDMGRFEEFNRTYAAFFGDHRPARSVVQVGRLPKDAEVEVELVAEVA